MGALTSPGGVGEACAWIRWIRHFLVDQAIFRP